MATNTVEIWRHVRSGELFAVELPAVPGPVVGAAGPLGVGEVKRALAGDFDSDLRLANKLWLHGEDYVVVARGSI